MGAPLLLLPLVLLAGQSSGALPGVSVPQAVNLWKLNQAAAAASRATTPRGLLVQAPQDALSYTEEPPEFPAQYLTQPLDHFSNDSHTFEQRYWINTRHYKPGTNAPVIVLDGGETSGEDRIPFLDTGIVEILAHATGGVGVVLEHRLV